MLWTDLELDRVISDNDLRRAWSSVFAVNPYQVAIVDDFTRANPSVGQRSRITLERRLQPGDFPLHITVILRDKVLAAKVATPKRSLAAVQHLCAALGCRALTSDDDPNPYRWILVTPVGEPTVVRVDPQLLDDDGALVLEHVAATTGSAGG